MRFWRTLKHFFSDRCLNSNSIMLNEKTTTTTTTKIEITNDRKMSNITNNYFTKIHALL